MMVRVDVAALVEELADFFTPVIEDADQRLVFHGPPHPVIAHGHEPLLRQAVGQPAAQRLPIRRARARWCACRWRRVRTLVEIVVADTGGGVPEDQRGRVQERFVRLDPARSTGGSGLGLAIVAACAKLHGGVLRLEDNHPGLRAVLEI